ncbi:MAG TPA: AI-2E family transporter [Acidimicrobiales bacterium]|nr:AI-2E family transporter [Acidimicrobiales bacterium]
MNGDDEPGSTDTASLRSSSEPMPGWIPKAILLLLIGVAGLLAVRWMVSELRSLLLILVVSFFLSFALEPAVDWLSHHGLRRGLATGLVMLGGFVAMVAFLGLLGNALFTQISDFIDEAPDRINQIEQDLNDRFNLELDTADLSAELQNQDVQKFATDLAANAFSLGVSAVGVLFQVLTIGLFTFYMVADGPRFRRTLLSFLPPGRQEQVIAGWEIAIQKTGGYIYSRGLLALLSAFATTVMLQIIGVPFALALGLWTGIISQFIPTIGTYLAGAVPVLVALLDDPTDAIVVLVFMVAYQQVENYLFAPKITAKTMDLHPAVAFGTVIVGASLFDAVGALVALPAAAVIQAVGTTYLARHEVVDSTITRDAPGRGQSSDDE